MKLMKSVCLFYKIHKRDQETKAEAVFELLENEHHFGGGLLFPGGLDLPSLPVISRQPVNLTFHKNQSVF
jgi:hypothetical protein